MKMRYLVVLSLFLPLVALGQAGTISGATIRPGTTPLTAVVAQPANTIVGNCTGSTASPTACPASAAKLSLSLTATDVSGVEQTANKDAASGYAGLTSGIQLKLAEIPSLTDVSLSLYEKPSAGLVAASNVTLSGAQTIDSVAGTAGTTIVLCVAQTTASQNGPWIMQSGSWTRPPWYPNAGTTQAFQFVTEFVRLGAIYSGSTWRMTTSGAITIGTTSTAWGQTPLALGATSVTGTLPHAQLPALVSGDVPNNAANTTGTSAAANALNSATTAVNVSAATAPTAGQVLQAVDSAHATWQTPSGSSGGGSVTSVGLSSPSGTISVGSTPVTSSGTITADVVYGTGSNTAAQGNDTRFPASVTGLRKGAGAGSADTAATASTDYLSPSVAFTVSTVGAASLPASLWTGTVYAAGSGTTNFPLLLVQPTAATASATWGSSGTYLGVNAHTSGDLLNLEADGASRFKVSYSGTVTATGQVVGSLGETITGGVASFNSSSNFNTSLNTGTSTGTVTIGNTLDVLNINAPTTFATGSTTITPIKMTSGTLNTTAVAGGVEYDGSLFYANPSTTRLQIVEANAVSKHIVTPTSTPVVSSCGSSPTTTGTQSDHAGTITAGTGATSCTVTFGTAYATAPHCNVTEQAMSLVNALSYTESTTALVVSQTGLAGATFDYVCLQ